MLFEAPPQKPDRKQEHPLNVLEQSYTDRTNENLVSLSEKIQEKKLKIEEIQSRLSSPFSVFREGKINAELDAERRLLHMLEDEYHAVLGEKSNFIE